MSLKNILPFEYYVLTTKLSVDEVLKLIGDNIQPKQSFSFSTYSYHYNKPYTGEINGTTFTMTRNINYRNSFLPVITGQIAAYPGQTQINIKMRPVTFVVIFITLWLGCVGSVCIIILFAGLLHFWQILQDGFSASLLIPFGMFAFGYLLTYFAFKVESKKSKEFLASLLKVFDQQ